VALVLIGLALVLLVEAIRAFCAPSSAAPAVAAAG